ncbi:pyruvate kinase [Chloropicon primus]|uniref:Pyruvate kinase n=1 Tax=Chloropicon primus TaxID=1764295 RepID=A0A5B8MW41_9CHLO|nr:pyruvate kinase [Chloropicon primus]UPR02903.1 pyruvate kinase [Chloropicon primus]|eukprot:QDZ23690.1 pyruvate kinase [Chloropicon primus]
MNSIEPIRVLNQKLESILLPSGRKERHAMTKVICTLGPNSRDVKVLEALLDAGMTAARFDFSWGSRQYHQETLNNLRQACRNKRKLCGVIMDTKGPEIAVLNVKKPINLKEGQKINISSDPGVEASSETIPVNFPDIGKYLKPGCQAFVGQYLFTGSETTSTYLTVEEALSDSEVVCICHNDARLEGVMLTVHLSGVSNPIPTFTDDDVEDILTWGKKNEIDFLSVSFCKSAEDVLYARELLDRCGLTNTEILSKIENKEGLLNFEGILENSYGLILSRGNLGIDVPAEKMFLTQKLLLAQCNMHSKAAIITRVVDTMTDTPRPTRAEATDVANAVLDGADAIMLGAETLRGKFPVESVLTVLNICKEAEQAYNHSSHYKKLMSALGGYGDDAQLSKTESLASSAVRAADKTQADLIICFTQSGTSARMIAKYRPPVPILTIVIPTLVSDKIKWRFSGGAQARQTLLYRGVVPVLGEPLMGPQRSNLDDYLLQFAVQKAKELNLVSEGNYAVVTQRIGGSDVLKIVLIDEIDTHALNPVLKNQRTSSQTALDMMNN